ncbi:unnamed protein product [Arctia plantaginis]|uniref:RNA-dependent RNA polymerase alsuviricetes domain-containing protein n=1 Tax=Arctia plantaginis TaxID=874455 RepID=A0A8S0Z644_ARCPL|nr:unnamed protein product [Arctia plantaginis]
MDVAYALQGHYNGVYSSCRVVRSLRLLRILLPRVLVFTGMSPDAFVEHLNTVISADKLRGSYPVENDMKKYDKSQDAAVLQFECSIMRRLGVAEHLIELWYNSHETKPTRPYG